MAEVVIGEVVELITISGSVSLYVAAIDTLLTPVK